MRQFSGRALNAVEAFADNLGVAAIAASDGSYGFSFARAGELSILPSDDGSRIILCLGRTIASRTHAPLIKLLDSAGWDSAIGAFVHAGVVDQDCHVLAVDIDEPRFNSQVIHEVISTLARLHDGAVA
jgi:hypothetical protein